jgi:hypothetical protein
VLFFDASNFFNTRRVQGWKIMQASELIKKHLRPPQKRKTRLTSRQAQESFDPTIRKLDCARWHVPQTLRFVNHLD